MERERERDKVGKLLTTGWAVYFLMFFFPPELDIGSENGRIFGTGELAIFNCAKLIISDPNPLRQTIYVLLALVCLKFIYYLTVIELAGKLQKAQFSRVKIHFISPPSTILQTI